MNDFILKSYIDKLSIKHIKEYAQKNNISLINNEDEIIYDYIKKYYREFYYGNPKNLFDELKTKLSCTTYKKIEELYYNAKKIKK